MLAGELALGGVNVEILERRPSPDLVGTRARGFHSRTVEIFDQRGLADRFLAAGQTVPAMRFADTALDVAALPSRHPHTLGLGQGEIERILTGWVEELGVPIRRGTEATGFVQDASGVDIHVADAEPIRAAYVVGADGGRSVIRRAAGIEMLGAEATRSYLIGEVEVTEETPTGIRLDDVGIHAMSPAEASGAVGFVVTEPRLGPAADPTLADLRAALTVAYGTDFGVHDPRWLTRFTDATRQATAYRNGRVLIAGDAAHTHPPTGGQGIGLGVQDAVNLGWKLAQVVRGVCPDSLLDTYVAERHPATARVLQNVITQASLQRADARTEALRATISELLSFDGSRAQMAGLLSGLDVRYDLGAGHPLLGRRMPDLELLTSSRPRRVFELLHDARPVLLNLAEPGHLDVTPRPDRVQYVEAGSSGVWELPVVGAVTAPDAVLIRPDGHVAWVGDGTAAGLGVALATWFGPAR